MLNGGGMCVHQAVEVFRWLAEIAPDLARLQRAFDTAIAARDAEDPSLVRTERRGFELGRGGDYSTHRYVEAQTNARNERAHSFWRIRDMARSVGSRVASIALRYMSRKDPTSSPSARNSAKAE